MKTINLLFGGMAIIFGILLVVEQMQLERYFYVVMGILGITWGGLTIYVGKENDV